MSGDHKIQETVSCSSVVIITLAGAIFVMVLTAMRMFPVTSFQHKTP